MAKEEAKTAKEGKDRALDDKLLIEAYASLAQRYHLPTFEALNADFDIDAIEPDARHLIREVARKIIDKIDFFKKVLETTAQPDVSILSMQEAEFLTDSEHERIAETLRTMMSLDRMLLLAELENDDASYVAFIIEAAAAWQQTKKELAPILKKMQAGWRKPNGAKNPHHYLG